MQYPADDSSLPEVREKIQEPEQRIAVDIVHISWPLGPKNPQCQVPDFLWWYAPGLHLVNNTAESSGVAGI